jgi:hypothetical protein
VEREQMACHLTHTTAATHALIAANLAETPVYGGWVDAAGPRYCPSIEDKIVRFADKPSHQARAPISFALTGLEIGMACLQARLRAAGAPYAAAPAGAGGCAARGAPAGLTAGGRRQVFLEPEGRHTPELYVQGFSTGLPERLQLALLHTLPGAPGPRPPAGPHRRRQGPRARRTLAMAVPPHAHACARHAC